MCIVVTIEVLQRSVSEWNSAVARHENWDYSAGKSSGSATYMAWCCVAVAAIAAFVFAFGSQKQKGEHAATVEFEIEDRPVHIGR
jgi:hypothetical protein